MRKLLILIFLIILISPMVIAPQPSQTVQTIVTDADLGIIIDFPKIDFIRQNQDHHFNFHLFNKSNGAPIFDPVAVSCYFHLFNQSGDHTINTEQIPFDSAGLDWEMNVEGGNFSVLGAYSFMIGCNTSTTSGIGEGGGNSLEFHVTKTGTDLTEADSILYLVILFACLFFFSLCLVGAINISWKNQRDYEGNVININNFKHFKITLIAFSYLILTYIFSILWDMAESFLFLQAAGNFFKIVYLFLISALFPLFAVMVIFWIITFIFDRRLQEILKRGMNPK